MSGANPATIYTSNEGLRDRHGQYIFRRDVYLTDIE